MRVDGDRNNHSRILSFTRQTSARHPIGDRRRLVVRRARDALRNQLHNVLALAIDVRKMGCDEPPDRRLHVPVLADVQSNAERHRVRLQATSVLDAVQLVLQGDVVGQPPGTGSHVGEHVLHQIRTDNDTRRSCTIVLADRTRVGETRVPTRI